MPTMVPKSYKKKLHLYSWSTREMRYSDSLTKCMPDMSSGPHKGLLPSETKD